MKRRTMTSTMPKLVLTAAVSAALAACGGSSGDGSSGGTNIEEGVLLGDRDVNGDGVIDVSVGDIDADGFEDYDIDGDGNFDTQLGDVDGDGQVDFDVNGDGEADFDISGDGTVDRSVIGDDTFLAGYDTDGDGDADVDILGESLGTQFLPVSAENPCGSASGTDNNSSNADWSDNCTVSRVNQHSESTYTAGIQRIAYCADASNTGSVDAFTDGDFGAGTQAAVEAYQQANGLTADGVVGPQTWAEMRESLTDSELRVSTDTLAGFYGVKGDLCSTTELFIANNSGQFVDSQLVIDGWALTRGANNPAAVEFGVQEAAVD